MRSEAVYTREWLVSSKTNGTREKATRRKAAAAVSPSFARRNGATMVGGTCGGASTGGRGRPGRDAKKLKSRTTARVGGCAKEDCGEGRWEGAARRWLA